MLSDIQNDHIFISYYHDKRNGYTNLEDDSGWLSDDQGSMSSVIRRSAFRLRNTSIRANLVSEEVLLSCSI